MANFSLLAATGATGGAWTSTLLTFGIMFAVFYFLLIRPQQKRSKQRNSMLQSIDKNDKVVTIGGIFGTIVDLTEDKVTLRVNENTKMTFDRNAINGVIKDNNE